VADGTKLNPGISDRRQSGRCPKCKRMRGTPNHEKMLKMKVDPAICMKTKHEDKFSRVSKAKVERFLTRIFKHYDASQR
jgi:hypothetical protein